MSSKCELSRIYIIHSKTGTSSHISSGSDNGMFLCGIVGLRVNEPRVLTVYKTVDLHNGNITSLYFRKLK